MYNHMNQPPVVLQTKDDPKKSLNFDNFVVSFMNLLCVMILNKSFLANS